MNRSIRYAWVSVALAGLTFAFGADKPQTRPPHPKPSQSTPGFVSLEQSIETMSAALVLPSGPDSALVVTPCAGCTPIAARADADTSYFLHKQRVTLPQFRAALAGKNVAVTVFRSTHGGALSRVIADADLPPPPAKTTGNRHAS
jgi:hypothetical protein